jgi:hypothetical protein
LPQPRQVRGGAQHPLLAEAMKGKDGGSSLTSKNGTNWWLLFKTETDIPVGTRRAIAAYMTDIESRQNILPQIIRYREEAGRVYVLEAGVEKETLDPGEGASYPPGGPSGGEGLPPAVLKLTNDYIKEVNIFLRDVKRRRLETDRDMARAQVLINRGQRTIMEGGKARVYMAKMGQPYTGDLPAWLRSAQDNPKESIPEIKPLGDAPELPRIPKADSAPTLESRPQSFVNDPVESAMIARSGQSLERIERLLGGKRGKGGCGMAGLAGIFEILSFLAMVLLAVFGGLAYLVWIAAIFSITLTVTVMSAGFINLSYKRGKRKRINWRH